MAKKVTEDRLQKLEMSSTDTCHYTVRLSWSSTDYPDEDDPSDEDVIYLRWSEDDEVTDG